MFVRVFQIAAVILLALPLLATLPANDAHAATINCTGAGAETITNRTHALYDHSAQTCTIGDGSNTATVLDDLSYRADPGLNQLFFRGTGGGSADSFPNGCTIGPFTAAANATCATPATTNGSFTATVDYEAADAITRTFTVEFTVSGGGTSIDITSATITLTPSTSAGTNTGSAVRALQATISRTQSGLIENNIGTRVASASAARTIRDENVERDEPSSGFADRSGFTAEENGFPQLRSRGGSLRDFALLASFDSSTMALSASESAQNPADGPEQRQRAQAAGPITVWGHGSFKSVDNDRDDTGDDQRFDGDIWAYNVGVDYRFTSRLVAGVSLGYAETDITTTFNTGTYDETSRTLSPYAIFQLTDAMTASVIAGYNTGDVDVTRDTTVTGATDSDTWFASVNGSYVYEPSQEMPLQITGSLNILISRKTVDAYTESDGTAVAEATSDTRRLKPGVEAAYSFTVQTHIIQPFVKADYIHDFTDETNGDSGAFDLGGGLRVASGATGLSGSLEADTQLGRNDYSEYSLSALIAYSFGLGSEFGQPGFAAPYFKSEFNPGTGPSFGTGLDFSSENEALNAGVGVTHSLPANGIAATAVEVQATLKF